MSCVQACLCNKDFSLAPNTSPFAVTVSHLTLTIISFVETSRDCSSRLVHLICSTPCCVSWEASVYKKLLDEMARRKTQFLLVRYLLIGGRAGDVLDIRSPLFEKAVFTLNIADCRVVQLSPILSLQSSHASLSFMKLHSFNTVVVSVSTGSSPCDLSSILSIH